MRTNSLLTLGLALIVAGCGEAKKGFDEGFNKNFHEKFVSSCVSSAAGIDHALATRLCGCAADKIDERYSMKEKIGLKNEQLLPIIKECKAANPA